MRNLKKFLALVLAMLMVVSAAATVSAFDDVASDNSYAAAIDDLVEKGIVNGVGDNKFNPTGLVERYQMALMMARALNPAESNWQSGMAIFSDVTEWYGAIAYAYMNNIVTGIGGGKFDPSAGIKYQDALIMAVRALGYTVDVSGDPYWLAAYQQAQKLGLTKDVAVIKGDQTLTRAETAQVIYNMLYATPADGGITIAAKNFGEATAANTTTFVVTATYNQSYADSKSVDSDYVGVQALVDGIPSGDIIYLPADLLGFDADEADDYFGYSFDFVNYNAKTGSFDKVIPGLDPVIAYSTDITIGTAKITYDGVSYYPVDEITGDAIKNEIVIFNGTETSTVKTLLLNKDGDVLDADGKIVATYVQSSGGTKMYLYNGSIITEAKATEDLGIPLSTVTRFDTLNASTLDSTTNKTYQLTMFDDDRDGKFERAVATQVYMSVYVAKGSDGKEDVLGPMYDKDKVTYTESLVKGDVFVYTYNEQTKVVNVIDVLDVQYGTIEKLDLTNYKKQTDLKKNNLAKVTIDGKAYIVGNNDHMMDLGATLKITGTAPADFADIAKNARISFTAIDKFYNVGSPIKFYAYNDTIVYAETYAIEDSFSYMVVNEITTWDASGSFTVNGYVDGVKGEYLITKMYDTVTDSYVNLSEINSLKFTTLLNDFYGNCAGKVYKTVKLSDGYQISAAFDQSMDTKDYPNGYNSTFRLFKALTLTGNQKYNFNDGITDAIVDKTDRIRTTASTKFYFIDQSVDAQGRVSNNVSLYTGTLADNFTINAGAIVYADKIGYGNTSIINNAAASIVIVYYTNASQVEGFNLSSVTNAYVYIPSPGQYTVDSAANLGLANKSGTYYAYGTVAVNLANGENLKVYSKYGKDEVGALEAGCFYKVDGLGIVTEKVTASTDATTGTIIKTSLNNTIADIDINNQYYFIRGIADANVNKVTKLVTVKSTDLSAKKTNSIDHLTAATKVVYYLNNDLVDGTVVLIVAEDVAVPPVNPGKILVNARWKSADTYKAANFTGTITDGKLSGSIVVSNTIFTDWNITIPENKVNFGGISYNLKNVTVNGTSQGTEADLLNKYVFTTTVTDGTLNVSLKKVMQYATDSDKLAAGNYVVTISNAVNSDTYEISFQVK